MTMNVNEHPCFNKEAHHHFGRIHLPVAPRCNIQCKFCNRQFDCVNESRPGVTSAILSPYQAMIYLEEALKEKPEIRVVGIAGPGDPFANVTQTLETLRMVRSKYPDMLLCVASNGLNILPYLDELREIDVSHITITVNAVDPDIGANIYSWMRIGKRVMRAKEAAETMLNRQLAAIDGLKKRGIIVKINSIILPGINDTHIETVARKMNMLGVDLFNCMPYFPCKGSAFESMIEPDSAMVNAIREKAGKYIKQMRHCTRCRSDAVGLLGETPSEKLMHVMKNCRHLEGSETHGRKPSSHPYVAVASLEGVLVNQHLGEAYRLMIYGERDGKIGLVETRETPEPGSGMKRWESMASILADCRAVLVSGAGGNPKEVLNGKGIDVIECEGIIEEAVHAVFSGKRLDHMAVRPQAGCGSGCGGNQMGCG